MVRDWNNELKSMRVLNISRKIGFPNEEYKGIITSLPVELIEYSLCHSDQIITAKIGCQYQIVTQVTS